MIIGQILNSTSIDQFLVIGIVLQNGSDGVLCYSARSILYNPELLEYFQNYYGLYVDYSAENSTAYLCYNVNKGENYPDFVDISFVWEPLSAALTYYSEGKQEELLVSLGTLAQQIATLDASLVTNDPSQFFELVVGAYFIYTLGCALTEALTLSYKASSLVASAAFANYVQGLGLLIEDVQHQEVPVVTEPEIVEEVSVQSSSDETPAVELSSNESLATEQSVIDKEPVTESALEKLQDSESLPSVEQESVTEQTQEEVESSIEEIDPISLMTQPPINPLDSESQQESTSEPVQEEFQHESSQVQQEPQLESQIENAAQQIYAFEKESEENTSSIQSEQSFSSEPVSGDEDSEESDSEEGDDNSESVEDILADAGTTDFQLHTFTQKTCKDAFFFNLPMLQDLQAKDVEFARFVPDIEQVCRPYLVSQNTEEVVVERINFTPEYRRNKPVNLPMPEVEGADKNNTFEIYENEQKFFQFLQMWMQKITIEAKGMQKFDCKNPHHVLVIIAEQYLDCLLRHLYSWHWRHIRYVPDYTLTYEEITKKLDLKRISEDMVVPECWYYYKEDNPMISVKDALAENVNLSMDDVVIPNFTSNLVDYVRSAAAMVGSIAYAEAIIQLGRWGERKPTKILIDGYSKSFVLATGTSQVEIMDKGSYVSALGSKKYLAVYASSFKSDFHDVDFYKDRGLVRARHFTVPSVVYLQEPLVAKESGDKKFTVDYAIGILDFICRLYSDDNPFSNVEVDSDGAIVVTDSFDISKEYPVERLVDNLSNAKSGAVTNWCLESDQLAYLKLVLGLPNTFNIISIMEQCFGFGKGQTEAEYANLKFSTGDEFAANTNIMQGATTLAAALNVYMSMVDIFIEVSTRRINKELKTISEILNGFRDAMLKFDYKGENGFLSDSVESKKYSFRKVVFAKYPALAERFGNSVSETFAPDSIPVSEPAPVSVPVAEPFVSDSVSSTHIVASDVPVNPTAYVPMDMTSVIDSGTTAQEPAIEEIKVPVSDNPATVPAVKPSVSVEPQSSALAQPSAPKPVTVAEPPAAAIVEPQTPLDTQPQTIDVGQIPFRDYFVGKFVSEILPSQLNVTITLSPVVHDRECIALLGEAVSGNTNVAIFFPINLLEQVQLKRTCTTVVKAVGIILDKLMSIEKESGLFFYNEEVMDKLLGYLGTKFADAKVNKNKRLLFTSAVNSEIATDLCFRLARQNKNLLVTSLTLGIFKVLKNKPGQSYGRTLDQEAPMAYYIRQEFEQNPNASPEDLTRAVISKYLTNV